ncbi:FRAS1-related extracellular matrix protein 2-like [Penaeus japonicus]|uniref:FRAS1-related extracellular matrix protein 2-like n=1 Tax=Penaeus japonicus TaxID=27405 RepID=UPI001C713342|nr:FRAS1-related extracellular matrix protein 2-like [Penaeus japonicus]
MRTFVATLVSAALVSAWAGRVSAQGSYSYPEDYSGDYGDYESRDSYSYEDYGDYGDEYGDNTLWDDDQGTTYYGANPYGTRTTLYDTKTTLVSSGQSPYHSTSSLVPSTPSPTYFTTSYSTLSFAETGVTPYPRAHVPVQPSGYDFQPSGFGSQFPAYDSAPGNTPNSPLLPTLTDDSQLNYGDVGVLYGGSGVPAAPDDGYLGARPEDADFDSTRSDVPPTDANDLVPPARRDPDPYGREDEDYHYEGRLSTGTVESVYDEHDLLREKDIILVNRRLDVPFGRVKYLNSETDLKIKVHEGHRCQVTVIENEPITQRPGMLTPSNFSCDFSLHEVHYTHLGGRYPSSDTIKLLLRYDTQRDTFIMPFAMNVKVLYDMQLEVVTLNMPLNVDQLFGTSNDVDRSNTMFAYDESRHECKITLLHRHSDLPRYGVVITDAGDTPSGYMVPCQQFLESGVRYRHTVTPSTRLDYIPAVVELYDIAFMTLHKQEYFQFPVRIRAGNANTPPSVSYESLLLMDVNQFVMTALTPSIVTILDDETALDRLIFNVTKPLGYGEGTLVSTDDQNLAVSSFYQRDIRDLKIAYKPPAEDSNVKRTFEVEFEVLDDEGLASEPFRMMIVVNPKKTKAPLTMKNTGLELFEGQSRRLSSAKNLEIADEDNLEDVSLSVIGGLKHGRLLLMGAPTKIFSPADLDTGAVVYEHDDSETYTDNLLLRMSDKEHEVEFLFPISIFPEDDQPPIAHVNTGFQVKKGELKEITPFLLSATDVDSDDASITYLLQDPPPKYGDLMLRRPSIPPNPENWQYLSNMYEKRASSWTQRDITDGFLYYRHLGEHRTVSVMDRIYFTLADNHEPPNESEIMDVAVKVLPVDDIPPELHSGCSLSLTVDEHRMTILTRSSLQYVDLDSKNKNLVYYIQPLRNVDVNDRMSPGRIVLTESPETVVTTFTQAQINHHKISYKPPAQELGIVPRIIQFEFEVKDEAGNSLPGQTFTIFLTPVDNQPPEILNSGIQGVQERSEVVITTRILDVTDPDTDVDNIIFRVRQIPLHGSLMYSTLELAPGNEFTRRDLVDMLIKYVNNGKGEMDKDSFKLDATDGVHTIPVTVFIDIEPIDDEPPRLLELLPGSFGAMVRVKEGHDAPITTKVLKATDPDSEFIRLTYIIHEAPRYGRILLSGVATSSFTQMAIEKNEVTYRHDGGDIGKSEITDNFTLILSDMSDEYTYGGNRVDQVMVNVTIEPIDNIAPEVFVDSSVIVDESSRAPITVDHIKISDADTDDEKVNCIITRQPTSGYVENTSPAPGYESSRKGIPVTSFNLEDIFEENINYVQSVYTRVEPREDSFVFHCTDGINRSPDATVFIQIDPFNDEVPEFFMKELIVMEGMDLIIEPPVLVATDSDEPKDKLTLRISRAPHHGHVMQQSSTGMHPISEFTIDDLNVESKIVYSHDNSETLQDDFEIELSDGNPDHVVRKEVKVKVLPEDDEAPRLTLNTGVEVDPREAVLITDIELMAEDIDSDDKNITFILRKAPRFGYLERLSHNTLAPLQNLTSGMNFTQRDVDEGVIQYRHTGISGVRDMIKFDLTDGKNMNMDRTFYIEVEGEDSIHPDVVNKGVELPEGGRVVLTTDTLSTSDLDSDDEYLNFTITRAPSRGHLEVSDTPGFPITSFTQLQLAGNKVSYVHRSRDEVKMDSFEFVVTDGYNAVYRTFRISISDVDNKNPVLFVGELRVLEGGSKLITPFELKLEDRDTHSSSLKFTITRVPLHGKILFNNTRVTRQFTQSDLEANYVTYHHDGSETLQDNLHFVVTDGTHADFYVYPDTERTTRSQQRLVIVVEPVDNGVPKLSVNKGASHLYSIEDNKGSGLGFVFSTRVLHVEDRDSLPEALTYRVQEPPRHGRLVAENSRNASVEFFTQVLKAGSRDGCSAPFNDKTSLRT